MGNILFLISLLLSLSYNGVDFSKLPLDKARALAKVENKKILIDFYTDWCIPCKELDKYIFQDSTISQFLNERYVCLKINAESDYGKKIGKELNLQEAYPTVLLLNSDGKEIDRIIGLITPDKYFQLIKDYTANKNTFDELLKNVDNDKSNLDLKKEIADKYFVRGRLEKAIEYYQHLTDSEKYNSDGMVYFSISRCYSLINNIVKAKEYVEKAISKNPSQKYYKEFLEKLSK